MVFAILSGGFFVTSYLFTRISETALSADAATRQQGSAELAED
jgi:hypothetical protein